MAMLTFIEHAQDIVLQLQRGFVQLREHHVVDAGLRGQMFSEFILSPLGDGVHVSDTRGKDVCELLRFESFGVLDDFVDDVGDASACLNDDEEAGDRLVAHCLRVISQT